MKMPLQIRPRWLSSLMRPYHSVYGLFLLKMTSIKKKKKKKKKMLLQRNTPVTKPFCCHNTLTASAYQVVNITVQHMTWFSMLDQHNIL